MTSSSASPVIATSAGTVRGSATDGIRRFAGIPYAEPPFGERRFLPPVPRAPWEGVRDATAFGATAPQRPYGEALGRLLPTVEIPGDDILTLNVWAPEDAADAPVLLWIHGGGLERGSAALASYDGTAFARNGIVFVSASYRLGSEGFSVFPDAPRNVGLRDVALALEWVHREIAAFGGDPARIALMGESAGGALVAALLSAPASASRAAGGIIESGPLEAPTPERAARITRALAKRLGVPATREGFLEVSPDRLLDARAAIASDNLLSGAPGFAIALDPFTLPVSPHVALRSLDVPVLIGSNTDEYRLWFTPEQLAAIGPVRDAAARAALRLPRAALRAARAAWPGASRGEMLGQLLTDKLLRAPLSHLARARTAPTYVYEFAWPSPVRDLRAAHALELGFVFDTLDAPDAVSLSGPAAPAALAREMHAAWVRFIREGDPGWAVYGGERLTRVFDERSATLPQRRAEIVDALPAGA